jgi:hypothetical protein
MMVHKPEHRAKKKLGSEGRQCRKAADTNGSGKLRRQKEGVYRNIKSYMKCVVALTE